MMCVCVLLKFICYKKKGWKEIKRNPKECVYDESQTLFKSNHVEVIKCMVYQMRNIGI
jgi:hypothetical protein